MLKEATCNTKFWEKLGFTNHVNKKMNFMHFHFCNLTSVIIDQKKQSTSENKKNNLWVGFCHRHDGDDRVLKGQNKTVIK